MSEPRKAFFFDAYALLRVLAEQPSYAPYFEEPITTDHGCLYEFTREVLLRENAARAREALQTLRARRLTPTDDDLVEAAKLRKQSPRLSAQDALGYSIARREGLTFLTGDSAFRRLTGVEFVV